MATQDIVAKDANSLCFVVENCKIVYFERRKAP
jgi:hypothetical protein